MMGKHILPSGKGSAVHYSKKIGKLAYRREDKEDGVGLNKIMVQ